MHSKSWKTIWSLTKFDLKNYRKNITVWIITIFSITFLYMILFPSVKEMGQVKLEAMPKELLDFVNMSSMTDLQNYMNYYAMIISLIIIAISIFATTFTGKIIQYEEKSKAIEFTYSLEISRVSILLSKSITSFIAILGVLLATIVANFICAFAVGQETFELLNTILIIKTTLFIPFIFMSITLLICGITGKNIASSLASGIVFISYMLGYLAKLIGEKGAFLKYFSPFELLAPKEVISMNSDTVVAYFILVVFFFVTTIIAHLLYRRRDFNI